MCLLEFHAHGSNCKLHLLAAYNTSLSQSGTRRRTNILKLGFLATYDTNEVNRIAMAMFGKKPPEYVHRFLRGVLMQKSLAAIMGTLPKNGLFAMRSGLYQSSDPLHQGVLAVRFGLHLCDTPEARNIANVSLCSMCTVKEIEFGCFAWRKNGDGVWVPIVPEDEIHANETVLRTPPLRPLDRTGETGYMASHARARHLYKTSCDRDGGISEAHKLIRSLVIQSPVKLAGWTLGLPRSPKYVVTVDTLHIFFTQGITARMISQIEVMTITIFGETVTAKIGNYLSRLAETFPRPTNHPTDLKTVINCRKESRKNFWRLTEYSLKGDECKVVLALLPQLFAGVPWFRHHVAHVTNDIQAVVQPVIEDPRFVELERDIVEIFSMMLNFLDGARRYVFTPDEIEHFKRLEVSIQQKLSLPKFSSFARTSKGAPTGVCVCACLRACV